MPALGAEAVEKQSDPGCLLGDQPAPAGGSRMLKGIGHSVPGRARQTSGARLAASVETETE
jgi:hypothetical protein